MISEFTKHFHSLETDNLYFSHLIFLDSSTHYKWKQITVCYK